jgi:hypothetical protein
LFIKKPPQDFQWWFLIIYELFQITSLM